MHAVLDEAEEAVFDAVNFQVVAVDRGLGDRADDRVQARTIPPPVSTPIRLILAILTLAY